MEEGGGGEGGGTVLFFIFRVDLVTALRAQEGMLAFFRGGSA